MTVLSAADVRATAQQIAAVQHPDGSIPWFRGGKVDPWNHVEAAMALDVAGLHDAAWAALRWLCRQQLADGSWPAAWQDGAVIDPTRDSNLCAYIACGAWMHHQAARDAEHDRVLFAAVERALHFVVAMQGPAGEFWWARDEHGVAWQRALVTGTSCIHHSLACGAALGAALGRPQDAWTAARRRVPSALADPTARFWDKAPWAMDWYYPVLGGVVAGPQAKERIAGGWQRFVVEGRGVRCVAHRPWVTAAETCELALALVRCDDVSAARELVLWAQHLRGGDAAYWTGANYDDGVVFPAGEQPTWTAAAVVLAADALDGGLTRDWLQVKA